MTRQVYTYSDLDSLKNAPFYAELYDKIHIGSSLKLNYKMKSEGYFQKNYSFNEIHRNIDIQWDSDETRIYTMTMISNYIQTLLSNSENDDEKIWLHGCLKEVFSIWSSIGLMEEANLRPEMIKSADRNICLMCDIWRHLTEKGHTIPRYRFHMETENAITKIKEILKTGPDESRVVVIHGFYYFTPIQERIMLAMEKAGYILKFLIPYNDNYPYANEIWTLLYRSENGYADKKDWSQSSSSDRNCFGAIFENENLDGRSLRIKEYGSIMEMVDDFETLSYEDCTVYSADSNNANDILRDFFPDKYGTRTMLSYPIGQFVYTLHRMWDSESQSILIRPEYISECFASGWASMEGLNSKDYFYDLQKILPFFENCTSIDEWNRRLKLLHSINKDIISIFRSKSENRTIKRWENVLNNPFSNFSMFDVSPERLNSVIKLINELIITVRNLFESEEGSRLNEHFIRLSELLRERGRNSDELNSELRNVDNILKNLMNIESDDKFLNEDISRTVTRFLAGDYAKEGLEGKIVSDWVRPLTEIDGNRTDKVHICLSDLKTLPGEPGDIVWPLTKSCIRELKNELSNKKQSRLLWHMLFILDKMPQINRYMIFSAFRNKQITISWISKINQKQYAPSPYISLMSRFYGNGIEKESELRFTKKELNSIPKATPAVTKYFMADADVVPEARLEYAICPKRYLYSYLLNENPTFKSDFLQEFAIGGFIKTLIELQKTGRFDKEFVEERVMELFPGKLTVIKQNILEKSATSPGDTSRTRYKNKEYTNLRYDIKFSSGLRRIVKKELESAEFSLEQDLIKGTSILSRCKNCPHMEYCSKTGYYDVR